MNCSSIAGAAIHVVLSPLLHAGARDSLKIHNNFAAATDFTFIYEYLCGLRPNQTTAATTTTTTTLCVCTLTCVCIRARLVFNAAARR
uniref:Secreted protein n=1 Tax=Trichogramma kaykai TaxID=54128 RepID=A0ABD2WQT5_9HYME